VKAVFLRAFLLILLLCAAPGWALSPERVLVVANRKSPLSLKMAHYYRLRRNIPEEMVLVLDLPRKEEISRPVYLRYLERPLAEYLQERHLEDRVLAIVLMPHVPHKIQGRVALKGDAASVDSELTLLYRKMLYGPYRLAGWIKNPFFGTSSSVPFEHDRFDVYLVTRLAGYTEEDVRGLVDRALLAPQTRPPMRLVLDARDGPTNIGDNWMYAAYLLLKDFPGLEFVLSFKPDFVLRADRVIGYASWGSNDPRYPRDRRLFLRFLPGAIGVTYVSTSARTFREPPPNWRVGAPWKAKHKHFAGSPQSLIADLVRLGITGISGNAYEPYLQASARPHILFPAYLSGDTLAEAYYRSLAYLSWQTVVLGDPLARLKPGFRDTSPKDWFDARRKRYLEAQKRRRPEDLLFLAEIELKQGYPERALKRLKPLLKEGLSRETFGLLSQIATTPELRAKARRLLRGHTDPLSRLFLAFLDLRDHLYEEAERELAPVLELPSPPPEAYFLAGVLALKRGRCQEAIDRLEEAIALGPGRWSFFVSLYQALKECGQEKRAAHIREAILKRPELADLWPSFKDQ